MFKALGVLFGGLRVWGLGLFGGRGVMVNEFSFELLGLHFWWSLRFRVWGLGFWGYTFMHANRKHEEAREHCHR